MAQKTRLLGQDVQIRLSRDGVPLMTITAIKSLTFEVRLRTLKEGYLGETGNRQDSIFDEVGGALVLHPEDPEALELQKFLADKAIARESGDEQVSLVFRTTYPSGKVAKVMIPEVEFETVPFNMSGRDAYVDMTLTYSAERYSLQT